MTEPVSGGLWFVQALGSLLLDKGWDITKDKIDPKFLERSIKNELSQIESKFIALVGEKYKAESHALLNLQGETPHPDFAEAVFKFYQTGNKRVIIAMVTNLLSEKPFSLEPIKAEGVGDEFARILSIYFIGKDAPDFREKYLVFLTQQIAESTQQTPEEIRALSQEVIRVGGDFLNIGQKVVDAVEQTIVSTIDNGEILKKGFEEILSALSKEEKSEEDANIKQVLRNLSDEIEKLKQTIETLIRGSKDDLGSLPTTPPSKPQREGMPMEPRNFVNRKDEVESLTKTIEHTRTQYFLVHAPAGYGKSVLIDHVKKRLEENWLCAKAIVREGDGIAETIEQLRKEMELVNLRVTIRSWGQRLAAAWRSKYFRDGNQGEIEKKKGIVLLFDFDKEPNLNVYQELTRSFILDFTNAFATNKSIRNNNFSIRVIIALRSLTSFPNDGGLGFHPIPLSPFDYQAVFASISNDFESETLEHRQNLAAAFLCYSGGHPGCIARIIDLYKDTAIPLNDFLEQEDTTIRRIVEDAINEMSDTQNDLPEDILNLLSVFRWFDGNILERLWAVQRHREMLQVAFQGAEQRIRDAYDFGEYLTVETTLFRRNGNLFKDSIGRRMRMIMLRDRPLIYRNFCQVAGDWCLDLARAGRENASVFAIEYLYIELLKNAGTKTMITAEARLKFQQEFLGHPNNMEASAVFDQCIQALLSPHPVESHARILRDLKGVIEQKEQWELRFLTNYLLRNENYTDEPVKFLYKKIDQLIISKRPTQGGVQNE